MPSVLPPPIFSVSILIEWSPVIPSPRFRVTFYESHLIAPFFPHCDPFARSSDWISYAVPLLPQVLKNGLPSLGCVLLLDWFRYYYFFFLFGRRAIPPKPFARSPPLGFFPWSSGPHSIRPRPLSRSFPIRFGTPSLLKDHKPKNPLTLIRKF